MRLDLGSPVDGADGEFGELVDVVIDPSTKRVTHLVAQPHGRHDQARLVPIERAHEREGSDGGILVDLMVAEIGDLETVREVAFLRVDEFPVEDPDWEVGIQEVYAMPYYSPGDALGAMGAYDPSGEVSLAYDRVPKGEVEIRRESEVTSSDGDHLGHVDGFVVGDDEHITHFVLQHGHLWGKRDVTIPIAAVERLENDEVILSLSRDEVAELKPIPVHRWGG